MNGGGSYDDGPTKQVTIRVPNEMLAGIDDCDAPNRSVAIRQAIESMLSDDGDTVPKRVVAELMRRKSQQVRVAGAADDARTERYAAGKGDGYQTVIEMCEQIGVE